ncbi:MAG: RidA family protein [Nocardioidaceae bacterium]
MSLERINPDELASPSGFSHAVVAEGRHVYLAGQTATGPDGRIVGGDVVAQFDQALRNLLTALDAAGGRPDQLASVTIYIVDLDDYKGRARDIGGVWRELVGTTYPSMAGVGVPRLWDDAALVELQGVAVLD